MSGSDCCWITALMVFGGAGTDTTQDASTWCNQVMPRVSHITQSTFLQLGESDTDVEILKYWCWRSHRWRCRAARRCLCPKPGSSLSDWSLPPLETKKKININEFAPMPSFSNPCLPPVSDLPLMLETSMLSLQSFSQVLSMHSWTDCMISRGSSSTHLTNTQTHRKHTHACLKPVSNLRQMKFWDFSGCENPECFKFLWKTW